MVIVLLLQLAYEEALMENSPSGRFVLKVSAVDPDVGANGQISYSLHGPGADRFRLNHRTGMSGLAEGQASALRARQRAPLTAGRLSSIASFRFSSSALTCYTRGLKNGVSACRTESKFLHEKQENCRKENGCCRMAKSRRRRG